MGTWQCIDTPQMVDIPWHSHKSLSVPYQSALVQMDTCTSDCIPTWVYLPAIKTVLISFHIWEWMVDIVVLVTGMIWMSSNVGFTAFRDKGQ